MKEFPNFWLSYLHLLNRSMKRVREEISILWRPNAQRVGIPARPHGGDWSQALVVRLGRAVGTTSLRGLIEDNGQKAAPPGMSASGH
jgi:Copper binding octapeptide repeat